MVDDRNIRPISERDDNQSDKNVGGIAPLGLIAGRGDLPRYVQAACRHHNRPLVIAAIKNLSEPDLASDKTYWFSGYKLMAMLKLFMKQGVKDLVLVGNFTRPSWLALLLHNIFDLRFFLYYYRLPKYGDNHLLVNVRHFIESFGFTVVGVNEVLGKNVAKAGILAGSPLNEDEQAAVANGLLLLKELGRYDVGQALVLDGFHIIAVEGEEGTDAMLERVAHLRLKRMNGLTAERSGFLLKAAKPQQSLLDDMPVIGVETVKQAAKACLRGIVLVENQVLIADLLASAQVAEDHGLSLVVVEAK